MSSSYRGDPAILMHNWLDKRQDFIISCAYQELIKPWKYWAHEVMVQTAKNKKGLIDRGVIHRNLYSVYPIRQPLTVLLFPQGTTLVNCTNLAEAWKCCQDVRDHCAFLMDEPVASKEKLYANPVHFHLEILFTTPQTYKYFLEQRIVAAAWTQIIVFFKVEDQMDDDFIDRLDQKLCPPESRSSFMICESFDSNARAIVQVLFQPTQHRIFQPYWSNNKQFSVRRPELLAWIKERPKGEKILVFSVGGLDANMFGRQGNLSSDGKQISSPMRYSKPSVRVKVFQDFNNGTSTVLSLIKEDLHNVDLSEVDIMVVFDYTPDVYIMTFNSSPKGYFQDPKRSYKTLFND